MKLITKVKPNASKNSFSSNDDSEEEEVKELVPVKKPDSKKQRSSVSAEVYGLFNKKGDFKPRVIKKTPDQIKRIKDRLEKAFMFQCLDEKESQIVINAMEEKKYKYFEIEIFIQSLIVFLKFFSVS